MSSPRAQLRKFLTDRFTADGALRRFVRDHFEEILPELAKGSLLAVSETFIGALADRGQIPELWPPLLAERGAYADEINRLKVVFIAAAAGGRTTTPAVLDDGAWLMDRAAMLGVYEAARSCDLHRVRPALLVDVAPDIVRAIPRVPRPRAQMLLDLDRLRRVPGDPPPIRLWLENALLIVDEGANADVLNGALAALVEAPDAPEAAEDEHEADLAGLEGIIAAESRPALLVAEGTFPSMVGTAWEALESARPVVHHAIEATGRLEVSGHASVSWTASAFVVAEDLVCTARHAVDIVLARNGTFRKDPHGVPMRLGWDPSPDRSLDRALPVTEAVLIHPVLDVAFLRVPGLADLGITPLELAGQAPKPGTQVAKITYVGADMRVDTNLQQRVFQNLLDGHKWVLPGRVTGVEQRLGGSMLAYDSSTLGGTSGSPVVDLVDGTVVGVGIARMYLLANWAVPAWELLRDSRIRDLGVHVPSDAPPPDDPWAENWAKAQA